MSLILRHSFERTLCHFSFSSLVLKEPCPGTNRADKTPCPNVLERNKLQEYLTLVASSNELTAEDIECHKPAKHAPPGTAQYEHDYENLVKTLSRSFTVKQLKDGHRLFGLELPRKRTKRELAISIIERQWRWPSLSESLKQRRDRTEVIRQSFTLSKREAFLLLGKDGSNLHKLSSKYDVQTSFVPNPLSLTVQGTRGQVGKVVRYMNAFKLDISADVLELPTNQDVSLDLCQRVSRSSGALVEGQESGTFQISYNTKDDRARHIAKALLMQGAYEPLRQSPLLTCISKDNPLPLSMSISESSHGFSLYPFTLPRPLPWLVSNARMSRARDVGGWFDHNAMKKPTLLSRDNLTVDIRGQVDDIRKRVSAVITDAFESEKVSGVAVQASFGHFLLPSPSTSFNTLTSPVAGGVPLADLLNRIKESDKQPRFIPSMPKQLLDSRPTSQRLIHRLVYHAIVPRSVGCADHPRSDYITLEFSHVMPTASQGPREEDDLIERDDALREGEPLKISEHNCWRGTKFHCDLMLPERAKDLRFTISGGFPMPNLQWPQELRGYKESLAELSISSLEASRGALPLTLFYKEATFVLRSSVLVRQSNDQLLNTEGGSLFPSVLICDDPLSDQSWRNLMLACDWLTAHEKSDLQYNTHQLAQA
ncbi:hypothetical protein JOM56_006154 [Amanita muscaria]